MQITCAEDLGMEGGRGGYYDKAGALRDMVQNHLLQLLCLVAMEPPTDLSADGVRDEKVKVFRSLRPIGRAGRSRAPTWCGPNTPPAPLTGEPVPGYREEDRVDPESMTEAYVALAPHHRHLALERSAVLHPDGQTPAEEDHRNFRALQGTARRVVQRPARRRAGSNVLVIRIQPDEGISLRIVSKMPGANLRLEPVKMDFLYSTSFGKGSPEAYERLLLDAMAGDATLFARRDEVEEAWSFIDPIEHAWHDAGAGLPMATYVAGTWGPTEADDLLQPDGRCWGGL